jgi:hypothetical protein
MCTCSEDTSVESSSLCKLFVCKQVLISRFGVRVRVLRVKVCPGGENKWKVGTRRIVVLWVCF